MTISEEGKRDRQARKQAGRQAGGKDGYVCGHLHLLIEQGALSPWPLDVAVVLGRLLENIGDQIEQQEE